jgi:hypothetical protein
MKMGKVIAQELIDSRGNTTAEVDVVLIGGAVGRAGFTRVIMKSRSTYCTKRSRAGYLNRTTGHWYSEKLCEYTLAVRSERRRSSGEVEEQAGRESGGLRLRCATLRPNGKSSTASKKVYESSVV